MPLEPRFVVSVFRIVISKKCDHKSTLTDHVRVQSKMGQHGLCVVALLDGSAAPGHELPGLKRS